MKVHNLYRFETDVWRKTMHLGGEIIQDNYLLLRNMNSLDTMTLDKMESLSKLHQAQHAVKFTDDDDKIESDPNNVLDLSIDSLLDVENRVAEPDGRTKRPMEDVDGIVQEPKRTKGEELANPKPVISNVRNVTANGRFKMPTAVSTAVKPKEITTNGLNDTFDIESNKGGNSDIVTSKNANALRGTFDELGKIRHEIKR
jgi:hypothetical protein